MTMFLTDDEIRRLTGQRASHDQIRWLLDKSIPFEINRKGWPVVARSQESAIESVVDKTLPNETLQKLGHQASIDDILASKLFAPKLCGVYFLIKQNSIIYIGQSQNVLYRIGTHSLRIDFDHFTYIPCKKAGLLKLETQMIKKFDPPLNINCKTLKQAEL